MLVFKNTLAVCAGNLIVERKCLYVFLRAFVYEIWIFMTYGLRRDFISISVIGCRWVEKSIVKN
jgi:hypothetical protein